MFRTRASCIKLITRLCTELVTRLGEEGLKLESINMCVDDPDAL